MRVLIHIEEERRDLAVLLALGRLFEQAGFRVVFSTRRTTPLFLNRLSFDAALLATPVNIPTGDYPRMSRRSRLYILPTEGAIFEEKTLLLKYGGGELPDRWETHIRGIRRFFLWGDYSRRVLLKTGRFAEEKLAVVGSPRMDFFLASSSRPVAANGNRRPLGIISSFPLTNSCAPASVFQQVSDLDQSAAFYQSPGRHPEDRLWVEYASIRLWFSLLNECRRRNQPVLLRIHHRENVQAYDDLLRAYAGILSKEGNELPFEAWLDRVGPVAGFNSTTFFEIVAAGRPGIHLGGLLGPRLPEHTGHFLQNHYPIMDHVETPSSWDEFFDFVGRVQNGGWDPQAATGPAARQILRDACSFPRAVSTLARIVQIVRQDLGRSLPAAGPMDRIRERSACAEARALDFITFRIRRDPVGNCWFPLDAASARREWAPAIERYLKAAAAFPAQGTPVGASAPARSYQR